MAYSCNTGEVIFYFNKIKREFLLGATKLGNTHTCTDTQRQGEKEKDKE